MAVEEIYFNYNFQEIVQKQYDSFTDESEEYNSNVTLHFKADGTYDSENTETDDTQTNNKTIKKAIKKQSRRRKSKKIIETEEERRQRNRESAVMCRLRKKERIQETYKYVKELEATLNKMKEDNIKIQKDNEKLRKELCELRISLETKNQMVNAFLQKGFRA
jgi:hypothetical protein